ncbi:MAG: SPOR domain-containing protein [Oryzomonas sp.]|uniref:SPOR domain-containing protein n=1 Tax=Oryzomonas sp. TaxID=2855186 RepID=UPI002844EEEF|nr:SPOR domain-containing protein [Oryzomonas sp.]MDR3579306.1 SPOR domain-containing protein [Oryzomonas sp.]
MDIKPSNDSTAEKGKQNMLLVVLLILVAAFAYLYFFTGLIKPQVAQKPAETPAPQVVKMPLPPRDGQPVVASPAGTTAGAPGARKNAEATAKPEPRKVAEAEAPKEPPKPEPAKSSNAAPPEQKLVTPGKKPVTPEKKPVTPEKKQATLEKKPVTPEKTPVTPEKKGAAPEAKKPKTAAAAKQQPVAAVKKPAPAKENEKVAKAVVKVPAGPSGTTKKPVHAARHDKEGVKAVPATGKGPWTVVVGSYVLEDAMASDMARVRGTGLETNVKEGGRRKTGMNRLLAGEYPTRADAQKELDTLKKYTSDSFILGQGGKFAVYAGSYLLTERADSEKERLAAAGIKLTIKHAEVSIPAKYLTAGTFSDKKAADAAVKKLKDIGFKATLSRL